MVDLSDKIVIKKLNNKSEILLAFEIIKQRYTHLDLEKFEQQISEMIKMNDFKMVGAFLDDKIIGIAGYWVLRMLYCGKYIQVSSFIVDEEKRGFGVGRKILLEVEKIGKELSCEKIVLDSYTENKKSHSLYYQSGFYIRGFHFMKDI